MHVIIILSALLFAAGPALAQEFAEFQNIQDGFKVDFPGTPKVTFGSTSRGFKLGWNCGTVKPAAVRLALDHSVSFSG